MFREWQIQRLQDKIDDLDAEISKWGWSWPPSQMRKAKEKLARLEEKQAKVDRPN